MEKISIGTKPSMKNVFSSIWRVLRMKRICEGNSIKLIEIENFIKV